MTLNLDINIDNIIVHKINVKQLNSIACKIRMSNRSFVVVFGAFFLFLFCSICYFIWLDAEISFFINWCIFLLLCFLVVLSSAWCFFDYAFAPLNLTILLNKETGVIYQRVSLFNIKLFDEQFLYSSIKDYIIDKTWLPLRRGYEFYRFRLKYNVRNSKFYIIHYAFDSTEQANQFASFIKNFFEK